MPIYEYRCEDNHVTEALTTIANRHNPITCSCGKEATFIVSCPSVQLDGTDPGFPGAYDKWARRHEKAGKGDDPVNLTHV